MYHLLYPILLLCLAAPLRATDTSKQAVAQAVFDRLVAARGDGRMAPPTLEFVQRKRSAARCEGSTVLLEEAAYDICTSLGQDAEAALAGILAHELVHYYQGHTRRGVAAALVRSPDGEAEQYSSSLLLYNEAEADYLGGFLAHLAGFPTVNVMPRVLDSIYRIYDLPTELSGYPTLSERKRVAEQTFLRLNELVSVFDMGNALTALERYAEAAAYYDFLLTDFQSREVYNNTGVLYLMAALPLFQPGTLRYDYPILLDLRSRLRTQSRSTTVDTETRDFYLREAIGHFQRAMLLDADYAPALVNLASAQALLGQSLLENDPNEEVRAVADDKLLEAGIHAREAARLARRLGEQRTVADALTVLGILTVLNGDTTAVVPAGQATVDRSPTEESFTMTEQLAGLSIVDIAGELPPDLPETVVASGGQRMTVTNFGDFAPYVTILRHTDATGQGQLLICRAEPGYTGRTAMEIGRDDTRVDVLREYGPPGYTLATVGGELLVYPKSQLVFSLRDGRVTSWWLYQ
ncbi:hypothetical protein LEM8419_00419 [Neolewinella maritima]|uniref:Peptidase M48 domain-containing protein n=1 Tax=Neolewinella maritima TaxID=1383882 RepID=A0ABN8F3P4_9BACT|nr:hypothetical protein [Neolewinella maritima]CAH0999123.1 hypothetical protein LEM8419_00419 [Neolewinella maritima]